MTPHTLERVDIETSTICLGDALLQHFLLDQFPLRVVWRYDRERRRGVIVLDKVDHGLGFLLILYEALSARWCKFR